MVRTDGTPTIANGAEAPKPFDLLSSLLAFEQGEMDEGGVVELFQHLVDTGQAWTLQGFYGRTAVDLIDAGLVTQ